MRSRTVLAFLIAPLAVPAGHILLATMPFMGDPGRLAAYPELVDSILTRAVVFGVVAYAGMMLLGAPIAWWAAQRGVVRAGAAGGWGFSAGAVGGIGAGWLIKTYLQGSIASPAELADAVMPWVILAVAGGVAGSLVGAMYWAIARPDLAEPDSIGVDAVGSDLPGLAPLAASGAGFPLGANDLDDRKRAG